MTRLSIRRRSGPLFLLLIAVPLLIPGQGNAFCVSGACFDDLHRRGMPRGGGGGGGYYVPAPSGPTPRELQKQREEKDLREAADDANDKGVEFAEKGDWSNAKKYLLEALEYSPDDENIKHNLRRVEEYARKAEQDRIAKQKASDAARQLKSVEHHGTVAKDLSREPSSLESRKGFDTGGDRAGSLDAMVVDGRNTGKEPVIPKEKRTTTVTTLEKQRDEVKTRRIDLEKNVAKMEEKASKTPEETVALAKLKQEVSTTKNKEIFLNFSISEELRKPTESPGKQ